MKLLQLLFNSCRIFDETILMQDF